MNKFFVPQNSDRKHDIYAVEIDRFIINILKDIPLIGHGELRTKIEQELKRKIFPSTFSKHLKRLADKGLIKKEEHGIGRKTDYSLTELALKEVSLGLIGNDIEKSNLLKRVYTTIFFYDIYCLAKVISSEEDFKQLLAKFKLSVNDLNWWRTTFSENSDAANLAYGIGSNNTFFDHHYWQTYFEFWKDRNGTRPVLVEIKHICYPKPEFSLDFEIERIDYWQFNKKFPICNYLKEWYLYLPGFSRVDILSIHPDLDSDTLTDGLNRLTKIGLVKELIPALNEDRFRIADDSLRNLLAAAWTIHRNGEFDRLTDKWSLFDQPTEDEVDRMKILLGNDEAKRIFRIVNLRRSKFNVFRRKCKSAKDLHEYIIWEWTPKVAKPILGTRSSMADSEDLKFLYRISNDFQDIVFAQKLDRFRDMKKNGKIASKKRTKNEVDDYFEFLRDGLYRDLKFLPFSADDNVEDIKIAFRNTIINYAFLEDIIRDICPKILEPIDEDIQQEIEEIQAQSKMRDNMTDLIYVIKQRIKGKITVIEIRDRSEIHKFQTNCLKMGTIYHYDMHKTFNSITQRFEHREIFHLLDQREIESGKFPSVHVIERVYNPITRRVEEQPVIHLLDINKSHTNRTKRKGNKSRESL